MKDVGICLLSNGELVRIDIDVPIKAEIQFGNKTFIKKHSWKNIQGTVRWHTYEEVTKTND